MNASANVFTDTLNPVQLALSLKPSYVARTISADVDHMTRTIRHALHHQGFAFVHVLQHCPTYSKTTDNHWLLKNSVDVSTIKNYSALDLECARAYADKTDKFYTGLLYHNPSKPSYNDLLENRKDIATTPVDEVKHYDISGFLKGL